MVLSLITPPQAIILLNSRGEVLTLVVSGRYIRQSPIEFFDRYFVFLNCTLQSFDFGVLRVVLLELDCQVALEPLFLVVETLLELDLIVSLFFDGLNTE